MPSRWAQRWLDVAERLTLHSILPERCNFRVDLCFELNGVFTSVCSMFAVLPQVASGIFLVKAPAMCVVPRALALQGCALNKVHPVRKPGAAIRV
mmetsp:Transcript_89646/g.226180  ORF Transcript_89646/g.226180 Transcript_89646/m.226180 type:complete len:95 (+) Transcript_89646:99-383(+)